MACSDQDIPQPRDRTSDRDAGQCNTGVAASYHADATGRRRPTYAPEGFTLGDMVTDVAGLIGALDIGPCRIVGFSPGGMIVQELLLAYADLITQAVLMASCGRSDTLRTALSESSPLGAHDLAEEVWPLT